MARLIRLATVKATGRRYIVSSLDFRANRAYLRGELVRARGARTTHRPTFGVDLAEVEITEVPKTQALVDSLFQETLDAAVRDGARLRETGRKHRNVRIVGHEDPAVVRLARELGVDLANCTYSDYDALRAMANEE